MRKECVRIPCCVLSINSRKFSTNHSSNATERSHVYVTFGQLRIICKYQFPQLKVENDKETKTHFITSQAGKYVLFIEKNLTLDSAFQ